MCVRFQMAAPTELTSAMTSRMQNRTRICTLVTRSTLERFRGALVEFWDQRHGGKQERERHRDKESHHMKEEGKSKRGK